MNTNYKKGILCLVAVIFLVYSHGVFAETAATTSIANPYPNGTTLPTDALGTQPNGGVSVTKDGTAVDTTTGNTLSDCTTASAQFDLGDPNLSKFLDSPQLDTSTDPLIHFYGASIKPPVTINVTAPTCSGKSLSVSIVGVRELNKKSFIVPTSGTFSITMQSGEEVCGILNTPDCHFRIKIYNRNGDEIFYSDGKPRGLLAYDCSSSTCLATSDVNWKYISDTSDNSNNKTTLQNQGATDSCSGKTGDCYQLYGGLSDLFGAAGTKLSIITQATTLGEFINAIIAILIGIAGVLAVLRIMYLGVIYMRSDKVTEKLTVRGAIIQTVGGFILLLLVYTILRTINPDLLNLTPRIDIASIPVADNSTNAAFQTSVSGVNVSNIQYDPSELNDPVFLTYLAHQQGLGGAETILWAVRNNYTSIPNSSPFAKNSSVINDNMKNNVGKDFTSVTGSSSVTPLSFASYWARKIQGFKQTTATIPIDIITAVKQATTDTGQDITTMIVMCRIESGCNNPKAVNGGGFSGLYQLSSDVFKTYGKTGNAGIFDPYSNAYAAAKFGQANLSPLQQSLTKN